MRSPALSSHEKLTDLSQRIVAGAFYGTLLKQVRESPFKSELFGGGKAEKAYGSLYDQQLAEHMARSTGQKLVKSLVKKIERSAAARKYGGVDGGAASLLGEVKG